MGTRSGVDTIQAFEHSLHTAQTYLFVVGVIIHFVIVTYFAGPVIEGGPATWWHLVA